MRNSICLTAIKLVEQNRQNAKLFALIQSTERLQQALSEHE